MGCVSMLEDIQERRDEAEYSRRTALVVNNIAPEAPPPVEVVEVTPEPEENPAELDRMRRRRSRFRLRHGKYEWTRDTVVMRGGEQRWTGRIRDVFIRAFDRGGPNRALEIDFKMPSKGGGDTHVSQRFGPRDFQTIIQAMLVADRQAALEAMTEELAHHRD